MPVEQPKAVVRQLIAAWNAMDRSAYAQLSDPSHLEEDLQHFDEIAGAFSSLQVTVEDLTAEDDVIAARLLVSAVHDRGPFAGIEPTGKQLTWVRSGSTGCVRDAWSRRGRFRTVSASSST